MSYPVRLPDQLAQYIRALRKTHGLTQAQLGAIVGVKQPRMAEIEADPGTVSLEQLTQILAALGGTLHLHTAQAADAVIEPKKSAGVRKNAAAKSVVTTKAKAGRIVIRPHKGVW
jgi:HTH-type transcriptional regulator/antitoxin HipB